MAEPIPSRPLRRPPRCVMIHPYVEQATEQRLQAAATAIGRAPEQLAGWILDRVCDDVQLQRLLKI